MTRSTVVRTCPFGIVVLIADIVLYTYPTINYLC